MVVDTNVVGERPRPKRRRRGRDDARGPGTRGDTGRQACLAWSGGGGDAALGGRDRASGAPTREKAWRGGPNALPLHDERENQRCAAEQAAGVTGRPWRGGAGRGMSRSPRARDVLLFGWCFD